MNTEALLAYIEQPGLLHRLTYQELKTMVIQYPYCQNLRHLLLIKSNQVDHGDFERNLQLAATYSLDRTLLSKQMKDNSFKAVFTESGMMAPAMIAVPAEQAEALVELPIIAQQAASDNMLAKDFISAQDLVRINGAQQFEDDLDLDALKDAVKSLPKPAKTGGKTSLEDLFTEKPSVEIPLEITNAARVQLTEEDKTYLSPAQAESFTDWLQNFRATNPATHTTPPAIEEEKEPFEEEIPVAVSSTKEEENEYTDDDQLSEEYTHVAEIVEKSVVFQVFNASETLADLLVIQEQYAKAIEVYEQLSLKYPEKKAFFAQKIAVIKDVDI